MNCEQAQSRIQDHIDDRQVDPTLDAHLAGCGDCRTYAEQMRLLTAALGDLRQESEAIVARPPGTASGDDPRRATIPSGVWRLVRLARIAAALAILVTGSMFIMPLLRDGEQSTMPTPDVSLAPGVEETVSKERPDPRLGISLRGKSRDTVLAVAVPTKDPNVQMYWLYPVLDKKSTVDPSL